MKNRLLTALILCIILIPILFIGGIPFEICICLLSILSLRELLKNDNNIPDIIKVISYFLVALLSVSMSEYISCVILILLFLLLPMIFINKNTYNYDIAIKLFGAIIFIGTGYYSINSIRIDNLNNFIYLLLIPICTDTFAYIGGILLGKHKLIPKISPNKTIEGSVIGLIIGTLIPSIFYYIMVDSGLNMLIVILFTLIIAIFSEFGDLIFSSIKRYYKIKDFESYLKGHGGFLDRFDSLLISSLVYILIMNLFL